MSTGSWRLVAGMAALALVAASCGGSDDEPEALDTDSPSPDVTEDSSPEPTSEPSQPAATETPEMTDAAGLIDFELPPGLSFVDVPEVEEGSPEASALRAYLIFEAYNWQALMEDDVPEEINAVASADALAGIELELSYQRDTGYRMGGTVEVAPFVETATQNSAIIVGCLDQSNAIILNDDGTEEPPTYAQVGLTSMLESIGGMGWQVMSREAETGCSS